MRAIICLSSALLFLFYLIPDKLSSENTSAVNPYSKPYVIFAAMVIPGQNEVESIIWARSIRNYAGNFSTNPVWIFIPNDINNLPEPKRIIFNELDVELFPFVIDDSVLHFPLAAKPVAAAEAERTATGKCEFLAWTDPDNMFLNEPVEFILPPYKNLGYRPVHHINIGSIYADPLNEFWNMIYQDCQVTPEKVFPMRPNIEDTDIRPYFNAGHIIVRPERGILSAWRDKFLSLYLQPAYLDLYRKNPLYAVFVHQAVFSAICLSLLNREEMVELPVTYNYPLNLYSDIPAEKRIKKLNNLVTARYDQFTNQQQWVDMIDIDEPLKSWIEEQFR
jgi:hypothetical protein